MRKLTTIFLIMTSMILSALSIYGLPAVHAQGDRIFAADSFSGSVLPIYEVTGGTTVQFASLNAGGYIGDLAVRDDGRLFAETNFNGGSLWDITPGGDFTSSTPIATSLFPAGVGFLEGLAFDDSNNAYVANSEVGSQRIAKVASDGSISNLSGSYNNPRGLAHKSCSSILYIAEGGTGRVLAFDLKTETTTVFATGFTAGNDHIGAELATGAQGRILALWSANNGYGLFDITNGGDFSGNAPLVGAPFRIDVNQIATDSSGNVYAAGDGAGSIFISRFNGVTYSAFAGFAGGVGDTESVAVVPHLAVSCVPPLHVSKFFTDSSLNPLPLDSNGNPMVNVTLAHGQVVSTNPGQVLAWINVTNTSGSALKSLKLNETLPVDWAVDPPWKPGIGAIHVFFANTTSLSTNLEITQPSTITVSTSNPQTVHLAIANLTATAIGHPLMPGQSILVSVKLTYALIKTTQSFTSYPRNYTDTTVAVAWTQPSFIGNQFIGNASAFFVADAKVVG